MESQVTSRVENERLEEMASKVRAWVPPTADHEGLKTFMLEQISISMNRGWAQQYVRDAEDKSPEGYFINAVSQAVKDVQYHTAAHEKEIARAASRNAWIDQLYNSLPQE